MTGKFRVVCPDSRPGDFYAFIAVGVAALPGGSAASAAENAVKAKTSTDVTQQSTCARARHHRHYGYRHGYRHYGYRSYRPYYGNSYGYYAPRPYYGGY